MALLQEKNRFRTQENIQVGFDARKFENGFKRGKNVQTALAQKNMQFALVRENMKTASSAENHDTGFMRGKT